MACSRLQNSFLHGVKLDGAGAGAGLDYKRRGGNSLVVCSVASAGNNMSSTDIMSGGRGAVAMNMMRPTPFPFPWTSDVEVTPPANTGKFGRFGGKFVPETLITCLNNLESEFNLVLNDPHFQVFSFLSFFFLEN